jgi:hypothetical protein
VEITEKPLSTPEKDIILRADISRRGGFAITISLDRSENPSKAIKPITLPDNLKNKAEKFIAIDFETANFHHASICQIGLAAFETEDLHKAIKNQKIVIAPNSPSPENPWTPFVLHLVHRIVRPIAANLLCANG